MSTVQKMQVDKLVPLDLWGLVALHLWRQTSAACGSCGRGIIYEVRTVQMRDFQLVCRRWRLGWRRMVGMVARLPLEVCAHPGYCFARYLIRAPPLPGIILLPELFQDEVWQGRRTRLAARGIARVLEIQNDRRP